MAEALPIGRKAPNNQSISQNVGETSHNQVTLQSLLFLYKCLQLTISGQNVAKHSKAVIKHSKICFNI